MMVNSVKGTKRKREISTRWVTIEAEREEERARSMKYRCAVREGNKIRVCTINIVWDREKRASSERWKRKEERRERQWLGDEGDRRNKESPDGPGMANGGAVRPTQTGPRFKAPGSGRYISFHPFLSYDHLPSSRPCNTIAFTTKRHRHARTGTHTYGRDARECMHITACRRICFDHIPSSRIIGSAMYRVFFRDSRVSIRASDNALRCK